MLWIFICKPFLVLVTELLKALSATLWIIHVYLFLLFTCVHMYIHIHKHTPIHILIFVCFSHSLHDDTSFVISLQHIKRNRTAYSCKSIWSTWKMIISWALYIIFLGVSILSKIYRSYTGCPRKTYCKCITSYKTNINQSSNMLI